MNAHIGLEDGGQSGAGLHVLVDDDALARMLWESEARARGVSYRIFASPMEYLAHAHELGSGARFYLDYEMNAELDGIDLARLVRRRKPRRVYLVTGHPANMFQQYVANGLLDGIYDKGFVEPAETG